MLAHRVHPIEEISLKITGILTTYRQAIYLTLFYTKREYALRIGYLFVSAAIAGSLGGILAYG